MQSPLLHCYIVRIYQRISGSSSDADNAVGTVEQVDENMEKKVFSSYSELLEIVRGNPPGEHRAQDSQAMNMHTKRKPSD